MLDVFDALTHDRVYRPAMELDATLKIIREGHGTHFAPQVVDGFFTALDELIALRGVRTALG